MTIEDADAIKQEMGRLRRRLRDLDAERTDLEVTLAALERQQSALDQPARSLPSAGATVTSSSPASAKIALFRGLCGCRRTGPGTNGRKAAGRIPRSRLRDRMISR